MKIIKAEIRHADVIGQVHSEAWKQAYEKIFSSEYLAQDTEEKRRQEFLYTYNSNIQYFLLEFNEVDIGIMKIHALNNICEIMSIYLLKSYWRMGFGTRAIQYLVGLQDWSKIILWTLEENMNARFFYEKNGFHATGEKRKINRGETFVQIKYEMDTGIQNMCSK